MVVNPINKHKRDIVSYTILRVFRSRERFSNPSIAFIVLGPSENFRFDAKPDSKEHQASLVPRFSVCVSMLHSDKD